MKTFALKNSSNEPAAAHHRAAKHVPENRRSSAFPGTMPYIQRKPACSCDGGCPTCAGVIQPKLTIGQPNDKYEQEADRVADRVMRMPEPQVQRKAGCSSCGDFDEEQIQTKPIGDQITPLVQRQEEEEIEEEDVTVRPKSADNKSPPAAAGAGLQSRIQLLKGGGQPLPQSSRSYFEPRFGRDFSQVRVHTDRTAVQMTRDLNAQAFTYEKNIFFNHGKYSPGTSAGNRLLAHELTHVVQQGKKTAGAPAVQRLGDLSQRPGDLTCPLPDSSPLGEYSIIFGISRSALSDLHRTTISNFVARWHARGGIDDVRLDGYASTDGPDPLNWRLSCARALAVRAEMLHPTDGSPGIPARHIHFFAHGETDEFHTSLPPNRRTEITSIPLRTGVRRCEVRTGPTYTPNGTLPAPPAPPGTMRTVDFDLDAEFENDPANGVYPSCCEIRQYILWTEDPPPRHAGFTPVANFDDNVWYEDRDDNVPDGRYGHRAGIHSQPIVLWDEYIDAAGNRDMANGHIYRGWDGPGTPFVRNDEWQFILKVIDTCNGDRDVGSVDYVAVDW